MRGGPTQSRLQNVRLHLCCWTYLLQGFWPCSLLRPSHPSCSDPLAHGSTPAVSAADSRHTVSFGPGCYMCAFSSVCSIENEGKTVLTGELNGIFIAKCCGLHTLVMLHWGWCWRALWGTGSQTWHPLIHTGYGAAPCRTAPRFCFRAR